MTKTDQEAAEEWIKDQEKKGNWLSIDALPGKSYCQSYDLAFLAGCAHRDRAHKEELKEKLREAFDAAKAQEVHTSYDPGLPDMPISIAYPKFSNFNEWLAEQEDLK